MIQNTGTGGSPELLIKIDALESLEYYLEIQKLIRLLSRGVSQKLLL